MDRSALLLGVMVLGLFAPLAHAQEADPVAPADDQTAVEEDRPRWALEPWEKIRFGAKAGASWAVLRGELPIPELGILGFHGDFGFAAGISFEVPLSRELSLQPELLIVRKHAEIDLRGSDYEGSESLSANYLELPFLLKWYPGERRGVISSLQAGPTVALRMDAFRESRTPDGRIEDIEGKTLVKATDWSMTVGAGLELHEFIWALTLDLRYTHGLSNIDNSASGSTAKWSGLYLVAGVTW